MRANALILASIVATACAPGPVPGIEPADAGDVAADAGPADAGGDTPDAGSDDPTDAGHPIEAPDETWTYVPFPEAKCGNGTETGLGVNLKPGATTLLVYVQGGGACWEAGACYILKTAVHVEDTVQEAVVLAEARSAALDVIFDRDDVDNPFRDAHHVYVPYCTGDLHAGANVKRYEAFAQTRDLHHVGGNNMEAYVDRLAATPGVDRVVLIGTSAGGFGVLMNAWRFREAFGPDVRVDVLNDSGLPVPMAWDRFGTAMAAWKTEWPPGCDDCATTGFPALLPHYAEEVTSPARIGLFAYREDGTIANFFGITGADIRASLETQRAAAAANQRFFRLDGTQHVVLATPNVSTADGVSAREWLRRFATDDARWDHAGP